MFKQTGPIFSSTELTPESFKELLPEFFEEIKEDFDSLEESLIQKDLVKFRRMAHKIKGSAASYSAILISERARLLQECIDKNDTDHLDKMAIELEKSIDTSYLFAVEHFKIS